MHYLLFLCMSMLVRSSFSPINTGNRGLVRPSRTLNGCKLKTFKRWTSNLMPFLKFAMTLFSKFTFSWLQTNCLNFVAIFLNILAISLKTIAIIFTSFKGNLSFLYRFWIFFTQCWVFFFLTFCKKKKSYFSSAHIMFKKCNLSVLICHWQFVTSGKRHFFPFFSFFSLFSSFLAHIHVSQFQPASY